MNSTPSSNRKTLVPVLLIATAAMGAGVFGYLNSSRDFSKAVEETQVQAAAEPAKPVEVAMAPAKPVEVAVAPAKPLEAPKPVIEAVVEAKKPTFDTVSVEKDGAAVIAGRAEPDTTVTVKLNGAAIGKAETNAAGEFVVIPDKQLPEGAGGLSLEVEKDGKITTSDQQVAVVVKPKAEASEPVVALVAPDQPTKLVPSTTPSTKPSDIVKVDTVDYDAEGNIIFSGRASPGSSVRVYVDNSSLGDVKVQDDGKWLFDQSPKVAAGNHTLRAVELNAKGEVVSRVELPLLREDKQKVAELQQAAPVDADGDTRFAVGPERIVIQPGNSLWRVSRVIYGKGIKYTVIFDANRDQIRNPNRIYPGQIFAAPKL